MTTRRLLICDDSSFSRRGIERALPQALDLTVSHTDSGQEAVRACLAGEVDLLFLDLNMPGLDGFEVLEQLQTQNFSAPIVVITANIQSAPMQRAKILGARAVINKPIDENKLAQLLNYLVKEGSL
ncbi:MAG: response regulator [Deltaproteobacteria bacterium]|nr:response regulator [Deltaproteobacteria bacterium]